MSKKRDSRPAPPAEEEAPQGQPDDRRRFLEKVAAVGVGSVVSVVPLAAGAYTFIDPLFPRPRPGEEPPSVQETPGKWVQVAAIDEVVPGTAPQRFAVITDSWDAWNYYPPHPVGAVYLSRAAAGDKLVAFTATCPHLGCSVKFQPAANGFACPCHDSTFTVDGKKLPSAVSPRDMDQLEVELRPAPDGGEEVWVKYLKYRTGKTERLPEA